MWDIPHGQHLSGQGGTACITLNLVTKHRQSSTSSPEINSHLGFKSAARDREEFKGTLGDTFCPWLFSDTGVTVGQNLWAPGGIGSLILEGAG